MSKQSIAGPFGHRLRRSPNDGDTLAEIKVDSIQFRSPDDLTGSRMMDLYAVISAAVFSRLSWLNDRDEDDNIIVGIAAIFDNWVLCQKLDRRISRHKVLDKLPSDIVEMYNEASWEVDRALVTLVMTWRYRKYLVEWFANNRRIRRVLCDQTRQYKAIAFRRELARAVRLRTKRKPVSV